MMIFHPQHPLIAHDINYFYFCLQSNTICVTQERNWKWNCMRFFLQSLKNDDEEEEERAKLSTLMNENCHSSNCYKCYMNIQKKLSFLFCGKDLFPVHFFFYKCRYVDTYLCFTFYMKVDYFEWIEYLYVCIWM